MIIDPKTVGEQIHSLRKIKGITQNELGERLSISAQAVSKWERGVFHSKGYTPQPHAYKTYAVIIHFQRSVTIGSEN